MRPNKTDARQGRPTLFLPNNRMLHIVLADVLLYRREDPCHKGFSDVQALDLCFQASYSLDTRVQFLWGTTLSQNSEYALPLPEASIALWGFIWHLVIGPQLTFCEGVWPSAHIEHKYFWEVIYACICLSFLFSKIVKNAPIGLKMGQNMYLG